MQFTQGYIGLSAGIFHLVCAGAEVLQKEIIQNITLSPQEKKNQGYLDSGHSGGAELPPTPKFRSPKSFEGDSGFLNLQLSPLYTIAQ